MPQLATSLLNDKEFKNIYVKLQRSLAALAFLNKITFRFFQKRLVAKAEQIAVKALEKSIIN